MTSSQRLLITGATGLLCADALPVFSRAFECFPVGYSHTIQHRNFNRLNLLNAEETHNLLDQISPDIIFHAAALANVDQCQTEPSLAHALNVQTTQNLVDWINKNGGEQLLIYTSTDQVYTGEGPHREGDVSPNNIYALTKLWGEDVARQTSRHLILRTNFFGLGTDGSGGLANWLINSFTSGVEITLIDNVFFNPLYSKDLAEHVCRLISDNILGTYNFGSSCSGLSKAEFARLLAKTTGLSAENTKDGKFEDLNLAAFRPNDMRMSVEKVSLAMRAVLPTVREGMKRLAKDLKAVEAIK
jgi:dTDP-4-dehydrorhamnose reductase